ncbi:hypothetical protein BDZ91DRAFT_415361 [Kalaharituber pfeilii]|nr:hypothetical protein BDZ91DRAFT_415361 [Kalaharituber pfeilii]
MTTPQVLSNSSRQFGLNPLGSSRFGQLRRESLGGCNIPMLSYTSLSGRPCKRPYPTNDENEDASSAYVASSAKRSKSVLKECNVFPHRDDLCRGYDSDNSATKRDVLKERKAPSSISSLANISAAKPESVKALGDVKRVRQIQLVDKKKSPSGKKRTAASSSPPRFSRKRSALSPAVGELSRPALLHKAVERARGLHYSSPMKPPVPSDEVEICVPLAAPTSEVPATWQFDIYEDSPAEMLQNLMEHSTTILDISDESDDEKFNHDEILIRGKENIPPERMREIVAGREMMIMDVDQKKTAVPDTKSASSSPAGKVLKGRREALKDLDVGTFYPPAPQDTEPTKKELLTPEGKPDVELGSSYGLGSGADFYVWASEEETDNECSRKSRGVKKAEGKESIRIHEDEEEENASVCGASDKEN